MVRSRKRITRKDIRQPDQFITFTSRVFSYSEEHRTQIFVALGLVVVLSLGLWGWQQYQSNQNRLASQAYARALEAFHDGKFQTALDLLDRVDAYRSPSYQRLAILYRANSHIGLKQ
ncbi:MAG: tetratricopeptide repeat protein, partial [Deltaproteobacteria bacterium]|nr:tetratricopeptide repeat protein [Deltaproteobacteria bacterium]